MSKQVIALNSAVVQAVATATANSIPYRDGNGDFAVNKVKGILGDAAAGEGAYLAYAAKTADHTASDADYVLNVDATSAERTITLPAASVSAGLILTVRKSDSSVNAVVVDGNVADTIDGDSSLYLAFQYESVTVQCNGDGWIVIGRHLPTNRTVAKSASFSVAGAAGTIFLVTVGAGVITVTLPPAAKCKDKPVSFKRVDNGAGSLTLTTNDTETVDGTNDPTLVLSGAGTQYDVLTLVSDGTSWHYLADRGPAT